MLPLMSSELVLAGVAFLCSLGSVWYASTIDRAQKDRDALRTYRFEARKRLYEQCEPVLFQLAEAAELARGRIYGLARTCSHGDLKVDGTGWLEKPGGYFHLSTMYRLFAPISVFRMLRRGLTSVDLSVDARIKALYDLSRVLYRSFRDDHELARQTPPLSYDDEKKAQGVLWGKLDNALEALTPPDKDGAPQLVSFGQFETLYQSSPPLREVGTLFVGFHPATHQVLWRMLLAQVQIYETLIAIHRSHGDDPVLPNDLRPPQHTQLAWNRDEHDKREVLAARQYIEGQLI